MTSQTNLHIHRTAMRQECRFIFKTQRTYFQGKTFKCVILVIKDEF